MLLVLKIPVIYVSGVVWYAIRAEPDPAGSGGDEAGVLPPLTPCGWEDWKRRRSTPYRFRRPRPSGPRVRGARVRTA